MNGIINVYKEKGYTSFDVVAKLRGILHTKKIGHTGTLDPMAEGVLPVCIGNATKVCAILTDKNKEYIAGFKLGCKTDTQDITGRVIDEAEIKVSEQEIRNCIRGFVGEISQLTPMYSARKVNGKKLYEYARQGIEVERKTKRVIISSIDVLSIDLDKNEIFICVGCEKGTYIRTLCNDIGEKLGCFATMFYLKRTKVDFFTEENTFRICDIETLAKVGRADVCMIPVDSVFLTCKKIVVKNELLKYVYNGNKLRIDNFDDKLLDNELVRVYSEKNEFLALYRVCDNELKLEGLFCN